MVLFENKTLVSPLKFEEVGQVGGTFKTYRSKKFLSQRTDGIDSLKDHRRGRIL